MSTGSVSSVTAPVTTKVSRSVRAGIQFPVCRTSKAIRQHTKQRVDRSAPIALAAVLEYLMAEILELSAKAAVDNKRQRITPRHVMLAIRGDVELAALLRGMTMIGSGSMPVQIAPDAA